jgi:bla regulator protein BlaR1
MMNFGMKLMLTAGLLLGAPQSKPSPEVPPWQVAAGGKMSFDVASVKVSQPETPMSSLFPLDNGDSYRPTAGRFKSNFPLWVYLQFAYKHRFTPDQTRALLAHLPKWVGDDRFTIEARVEGNPTKDQMRLMVQSLLADRFKLAVHFETQEVPVFALTLIRPGKLGPQLHLHSEGPACLAHAPEPPPADGSPRVGGDVYPGVCDVYAREARPNGVGFKDGSRNTTMALFAESISGGAGRPVLDQTGINEKIDFILEWIPEQYAPLLADGSAPPDWQGPTLQQALREQLGLKLESTKGPIQILVIDHVEKPTEN